MANLTQFGAVSVLNGVAIPDPLYVQLHIGEPGDAGTANLAAGIGGTVRKSVDRTTAVAGTPGDPVVASNGSSITWVPYDDNETATHASYWDDPDSGQGNCWFVGELPAPVVLVEDDAVFFAAGAIDFSMDTYVP